MAPTTFTSGSTLWIISRQAGPLPAVRRLPYLPELAEGVATVAALWTFHICDPRGPWPALNVWDAGCVIMPVDSSPPTKASYNPVQGRVTVVAASSSSGVGANVSPGPAEGVWTGYAPSVIASTGTAGPTRR
ncbi:MAG TPA: hypothetical protein VIV88_17265 [Gemmatimonadales bacterium]|jgi:hypothetical protein